MTSGMTALLVLARTGGDDSEQRTRSKQSCLPRRTIMTRSREGYGSLAVRYVGSYISDENPEIIPAARSTPCILSILLFRASGTSSNSRVAGW